MIAALLGIGIVLLLLLLNALFVAAEFAIVGVSRPAMERLANKGDGAAKRVLAVLSTPKRQDGFIATSQLGITIASLGLGMYGEHSLASWLANVMGSLAGAHVIASIVAVAVLAFAHIVVGEMVPKTLALATIDRAALVLTPIVMTIRTALLPLVWILEILGRLVLGMIGIKRVTSHADRSYTQDELRYVLRESQQGGHLWTEAGQLLLRLFEFGNLTAGEAMVPRVRVRAIPIGTTAMNLASLLRSSVHTRYPVYDHDLDHIVGMIHVKDAMRRLKKKKPLQVYHTRPIPYVPLTAPLDRVLAVMGETRTQMAVVMDEHGGTAGIITIEDIFEEVIGQIDETKGDKPEIAKDELGRVRASGLVRVEAVQDILPAPLVHDAAQTLSGLVLSLLGRPPVVGDTVRCGRFTIEVRSILGRGVRECLISETAPASGGAPPPPRP